MELNKPLPEKYLKRLREKTSEPPVYCMDSDIDAEGNYTDAFYIGATKSFLFVFWGEKTEFIELNTCESAKSRNLVNCSAFTVTRGGEEYLLARCTMKRAAGFAYIARGVNLLIHGVYDRTVQSSEREKVCPKCGRITPVAGVCPKCSRKDRSFYRLAQLCRPYTGTLIFVVFLMLTGSALELGKQYVLRRFVDDRLRIGEGLPLDIFIFFLVYFGLTLVGIVGYVIRNYLCSRLGVEVSHRLRRQLTDKIQELSMSFLQRRHEGEIMGRVMNDANHVRNFISECFCNMFTQIVLLLALAVIMLIMNWKLAIAAFIFAPLIIAFARTFWPHIRKIFHRQNRRDDKIQNKLHDVLSGIRIVKSYGRERGEIEQFCRLNDAYAEVQQKNEKFFATCFPVLSLLLAFGSYLIVYLGGLNVLKGSMTPGELMQFISYAGMLLGPLSWMSFLPRRIIQMTTSLDRIYDILGEKPDVAVSKHAAPRKVEGNIKIENIVFGYKSYETVLDGVSLDVKKGEMIGLVGSSGCGKSTLINLIMRLYDVNEGRILVDGTDLRDLDPAVYHSQIGVVLQETFLFAGTVADNISFACPDASPEEIVRAAKYANAHEFISRLPDGYNTYIGEKGHMLSGGEKQRVAIARAVLNDPKILILDEATSALDTESEYQIQQALERLRQGRTTFAIAHRLSTLRCADRIAVINEGRIAELGTHNELLRKKGIYYGLVMAQLQMNGQRPGMPRVTE